MSENRIKSAWEIALEKAEKLGKLSPEEANKRLDEEFYPRGKALAEKYLKGLPRRDLEIELGKFTNDKEKAIVKRGFFTTLAAEITLEEVEKSRRALEGILLIGGDSRLEKTGENVIALLDKYKADKDSLFNSARQTIAGKTAEHLKQEGIAGSAVQVNALAAKEWQEARQQLHARYNEELQSLKKEIAKNTG